MTDAKWWRESIAYQIYPRSFYDSNGDGLGDLPGIIKKLDYLNFLGVNLLWLNPFYVSPDRDNGYDISDYQAIDPKFGKMQDLEYLLKEAHENGMRIILDLVLNHTSDQHPWFMESRKSRDNPFRDYYIWRDGRNGREPNNWKAHFAKSAWSFDEHTGQYYLNTFSPFQPDLNWENPKLRDEIYKIVEWWLDKGVDGFRLDAISFISKATGFPDHPGTKPYIFNLENMIHGPKYHFYLQELYQKVLSKYDVVTVGECINLTVEIAIEVAAPERNELNMPFLFEHTNETFRHGKNPQKLKEIITRYQLGLHDKAWIGLAFNSHDLPRVVSMFGDDILYREASAKLFGTLMLTLEGTPFIYQGEEIGMTNVAFSSIADYSDLASHNLYNELVDEKGATPESALAELHIKSRDNARTPMQWDNTSQAGFSTSAPWIRVNPNYTSINVARALEDPNSIFYYYKKLIELRKKNPVLVYGKYDLYLEADPEIICYTRTLGKNQILVILNCSPNTPVFSVPVDFQFAENELLISNYLVDSLEIMRTWVLKPYEARVYRLLE
jgi:oligo-1,6-glucosidase